MEILQGAARHHIQQLPEPDGPLFEGVRFPPGYTVYWTDELPEGYAAITRWSDKTVWVADHLPARCLRWVLEHERQHTLRGPVADPTPEAILAEEKACDLAAAAAMFAAGHLVHLDWMGYLSDEERAEGLGVHCAEARRVATSRTLVSCPVGVVVTGDRLRPVWPGVQ